jgi:hypothetical protein
MSLSRQVSDFPVAVVSCFGSEMPEMQFESAYLTVA